jgi:hypothetical protein
MVDSQRQFQGAALWLDQFGSTALDTGEKAMLRKIQDAQRQRDFALAGQILQLLKRNGQNARPELELAEVMARCGQAAFDLAMSAQTDIAKLGYLQDAENSLGLAVRNYHSNPNQQASAEWMLGCVLWLFPERHEQAIRAWGSSIATFKASSKRRIVPQGEEPWYRTQIPLLEKALSEAISADFTPAARDQPAPPGPQPTRPQPSPAPVPPAPPATSVWPISKPGTPTPWQSPTQATNGASLDGDRLAIPVVNANLPASSFRLAGFDPTAVSQVEIGQVLIDGLPHYPVSLSGQRVVEMNRDGNFSVLKVSGDSMDQEGIEDGDYVLIRLQDTAQDGDFVVAVIEGADDADIEVTLKQFLDEGNTIRLRPRSNNPVHLGYDFDKQGPGFSIRGVALAVFKLV